MGVVYLKELRCRFTSLIDYIFIAFMFFFTGLFTLVLNLKNGYPNFEFIITDWLYIVPFIFLISILTMRMFAEERRQKTDQLLYSLPMKLSSVVLGKYFAALTVFAVTLLGMCVIPLILSNYGTVNFTQTYSSILAFFFMGAAMIAIGMFASTLTSYQTVSMVISSGLLLAMLLMEYIDFYPATKLASLIGFLVLAVVIALIIYLMSKNVMYSLVSGVLLIAAVLAIYLIKDSIFEAAFPTLLQKISFYSRFEMFAAGFFDVGAIVYYISAVFLFIFLSIQSLEKRRYN